MRHKSIVHATMNPAVMFKCKYCDKGFGRIDSVKRHQVNCKSSPTLISKSLVEELLKKNPLRTEVLQIYMFIYVNHVFCLLFLKTLML